MYYKSVFYFHCYCDFCFKFYEDENESKRNMIIYSTLALCLVLWSYTT